MHPLKRGVLIQKKELNAEELKITDQSVEFKCAICGYTAIYPSPESVVFGSTILFKRKKFIECTKCNQLVCKKCVGNKKQNICINCVDQKLKPQLV